ncbi:Uridine nucleosidase [Cladobotryum mycophilum]|uniref:Uridine nucleosidase n=1 Tax=Cladobotryum mycophilum TaxID=491253 RepID=A0ABR0SGC1_9HYPO
MNNEQFRKLMLANSAKPSGSNNGGSSKGEGTPGGANSLGSRQRASIPMTPRSVGGAQADFARQLAERNNALHPQKRFKSSAPKGIRLGEGYVDRARQKDEESADDREERLKALEKALKDEEIDPETYEKLRFQIAGGDLESTHLVKGLDFKLLRRIRQGEDVYGSESAEKEEAEEAQPEEDVDDELDQLEEKEVQAVEKEKTEKKKGELSTVALAPGKKRTRDQILAELKAARLAAKAQEEPALGDRFRKIGAKLKPGARIERDHKGREVLIIIDEDGHEKRKVRKVQPEDDERNGLLMPDKDAKPLGMEVPEQYRKKEEPEEDDGDVDIFDDVGDDYDPLAGMNDSDSDSDDEDKDKEEKDDEIEKEAKAETKAKDESMPPPPKPTAPRNYFKDSKTGLISEEASKGLSMSDPAILAALKKAATLKKIETDEEDDKAKSEANALEERRKKLLSMQDRDDDDIDMGFGTSRFEDEEDFEDKKIKLSKWGGDDDDGDGNGRGRNMSSSDLVPVWLDCDPGHDDAFAILLAAHHPRINLLGVSSVFGNASLEHTTHNAAAILTAIGKHNDIPLHVGLDKALERPAIHAPTDIHGDSGLDGTDLLPTPMCSPSPVPAIDAMAAALKSQPPGTAWIVATGTVTNVGALFRKHPELIAHIKGLSIMGGSIGGGFSDAPLGKVNGKERIGNTSPYAEFNILVDPEAAAEIFGNEEIAKKMVMVPLDLTHQVLATKEVRELLLYGNDGEKTGTGKTWLRTMFVELLYFFAQKYSDAFGITAGPPLHDPLAVAAVLTGTPDEITFHDWHVDKSHHPKHDERFNVTVITEGTFDEAKQGDKQTGRTVAKQVDIGGEGVRIPRGVDEAKFWQVIEECIQRADEANKGLQN